MTDTPDDEPANMPNEPANLQWGGRFAGGPSVIMQDINASIGFDRKLWRQDIRGSRAHAAMLAKIGLLSSAGIEIVGNTPEAFSGFIKSEMARMGQVIKSASFNN